MDTTSEIQHQVMGYDRAATLFSPDGHLLQVEYAEKAVRQGSPSIGMVCSDGVIIVADRRLKDDLMVKESAEKVHEIDSHLIASTAGILSDARVLIEKAQLLSQQHRVTYDSPIDVELVVKEMADLKQASTQYGGVRPFGISVMTAGIGSDGSAKLFVSDVTGNYFGYTASAIGESDDKLKELLKEQYKQDITIEQGIKLAINIFRKILGKNFDISRMDVAFVTKKERKLERKNEEAIRKYLK